MASNNGSLLSGRSSMECSQDVSHVLHSSFHKHQLHDLDSELVSNILAAKGSKDNIQETYVEALESVKQEYSRSVSTIAQLERHIMHAQTRIVSARERTLLSNQISMDTLESKVKSALRDCLDPELLQTNKLISPKDFFQNISYVSAAPKATNKPNYLKSLDRADGTKEEGRNVLIAWADDGIELGDHVVYEETSVVKSHKGNERSKRKQAASKDAGTVRPEEFWRDHVNVGKRNEERNQLDLLVRKTEGTKNPRFAKSSDAGGRARSLIAPVVNEASPDQPTTQPPIFLVSPNVVQFTSYEPGKVYESTLELRNVSAVLQNCRVIPPKSGFFGINFGEFPSESSLVAPGMACIYKIRFLPDSLCEFEDSLSVHIQERPPIVVPLIGRRPAPILTLPPVIDVGECLLAGTKVCTIKLKNKGGEGKFCVLPRSVWPCGSLKQAVGHNLQRGVDIGDSFSVHPGAFRLKPKEDIPLQIVFTPTELRQYSVDFVIVSDNCHVNYYSVFGEGAKLHFDISYVDGGLYNPHPSDYVDAFATSHIAFPTLNLGMAFDKKISIRNNRKIDVPFIWAVVKPHLVAPVAPPAPEAEVETVDSASSTLGSQPSTAAAKIPIPDCRIIEEQSTFNIEPQSGVMAAGQVAEFVLSFLPDKVGGSHSALHLIIPGVPQAANSSDVSDAHPPSRSDINSQETQVSCSSAVGSRSTASSSKSQQQSTTTIADVTALELDLRGSCEAYSLSLNPCAIFVDGPTMIRTSSRHTFKITNNSRGPAAFEWQPIADDEAIIEVEPKIGMLEPGATANLTAIITGTKAGRVVKQVPCWVEFCPDAVCLHLEATFKGPECVFREATAASANSSDNNTNTSQPLLAFLDFGLVRTTSPAKVQFTVVNTSSIDASWNLSFVPSLDFKFEGSPLEDEENLDDGFLRSREVQLSVTNGSLQPFGTQKVEVKLLMEDDPDRQRFGPRTGFLKLDVVHGKSRVLQVFADIQNPDVCLASSELLLPGNIFVDTVAKDTVFLLNKTNLSTEYSWDTTNVKFTDASECRNCEFSLSPSSGVIGPKERLPLTLNVKPLKRGILEAFLTCHLPEIDQNLALFVRGVASGLDVAYSVFENTIPSAIAAGSNNKSPSDDSTKCAIDFDKFKLGDVVRRQLVIRNKTLIPTNFTLKVSKFTPPTELAKTWREADIRRQLMSSDVKAVAEIRTKLLANGLGLAIVAVPSSGHLAAESTAVVEVFAVADMWGQYRDEIVSCVGDLEPDHIGITAEAVGSPLLFQMMVAQRHKTACLRFGVAVQGTTPITKKLRLLNEGPCDIRLDWRLYEKCPGDTQLVDLIYYMLDPFPEINNNNGKAARNNESPTKRHSRETLKTQPETIGDDAASVGSAAQSSGITAAVPDNEPSSTALVANKDSQLISMVVRKHEGTSAEAQGIFSVNPSQFVVKGRSHATVEVTLDPRQIPSLPDGEKFTNVEAFGLAFVSLAQQVREPDDGSVTRVQWFDAETVRLGITAQIQPALLTMESVDEESLAMMLPASHIVPKSMYADIESQMMAASNKTTVAPPATKQQSTRLQTTQQQQLERTSSLLLLTDNGDATLASSTSQMTVPVRQPITLRFYNYHETELRLLAEIGSPFKIVYFGTATRNALIDRPTSRTAEVYLPAHDTLLVKIDVDAGVSMIGDLDSLVPNLAVVDGRFLTMSTETYNRSVHYRRYLTIRYSNDTCQSVRLSCSVPLPLVSIAKSLLEFPVTLIGKSREMFFDAVNTSESDTWLQCHVETESDADRGCFRVRPSGCRVGPTGGRRVPLSVVFTPRHEGAHTARVVIAERLIGQRFYVQLSGAGSLDERHAL